MSEDSDIATPEQRKKLEKMKAKEKREIEVTVDTSSMERLVGRIKDLEPQAKGFQKLSEELARKCRDIGVDVDSSEIRNVDDFKNVVQRMYKAKEETEKTNFRLSEKGGEGQITLAQARGSSRREYDTNEEMISDLRTRASQKNEDGEMASAIIDELWRKSLSGQRELKRSMKATEYHGKMKLSGKEQGIAEHLAEEYRKRRKKEEDE